MSENIPNDGNIPAKNRKWYHIIPLGITTTTLGGIITGFITAYFALQEKNVNNQHEIDSLRQNHEFKLQNHQLQTAGALLAITGEDQNERISKICFALRHGLIHFSEEILESSASDKKARKKEVIGLMNESYGCDKIDEKVPNTPLISANKKQLTYAEKQRRLDERELIIAGKGSFIPITDDEAWDRYDVCKDKGGTAVDCSRKAVTNLGKWHVVLVSHNVNKTGCKNAVEDLLEFKKIFSESKNAILKNLEPIIIQTEISNNYAVTIDSNNNLSNAKVIRDEVRKISSKTSDGKTAADAYVQANKQWREVKINNNDCIVN